MDLLAIHGWCSLVSYGAFLIAFVAGGLFLLQDRQLKRKRMGWMFRQLPSLGALDRANFLAISAGFGLLTIGATSGFIEMARLRGRWWIGDPKEYATVALWGAYFVLWVLRERAVLLFLESYAAFLRGSLRQSNASLILARFSLRSLSQVFLRNAYARRTSASLAPGVRLSTW